MAETFTLKGSAKRIVLGGSGIGLTAPGLVGSVTWRTPQDHVLAAVAAPDFVEQAIVEAGLEDQGSLAITSETDIADVSQSAGPRKILLESSMAVDEVQFAIYRDENGVISLHLPISVSSAPAPVADGNVADQQSVPTPPTHHYVIALREAAPVAVPAPTTFMLGGIAGKVIRFVGRKVLEVVGNTVYFAAKLWEDKYRAAQGFHGGADANALLALPPQTVADWTSQQGKNSLLFIHGTISSTGGGFLGLNGFHGASGALYAQYANRVIGFNHHTLTKSVAQNVMDFYGALPPGDYQFDVISHSRGGLLARSLKTLTPAQLSDLTGQAWNPPEGVKIRIGKIVLVGTPDIGTPLANPTDLPTAVSRLSSIVSTFSGVVATIGLGALFAIFGAIVEGGIGALPGLEDMNPGSPLLSQLNEASANAADYFAIEADYQPSGTLALAIEDNGVDALFLGTANDLVVPTQGVSMLQGQSLPASQVEGYPPSANVDHVNYFYQPLTWNTILKSLGIEPPASLV